MTDPGIPADDDEFVDRLRALADIADPPPDLVEQLAQQALLTRRIDAQLAALLTDSATEAELVRADDAVRLVSMATDSVTVDVQITTRAANSVTVRGLVEGATGEVVAEWSDGRRTTRLEEFGEFILDDIPARPFRLVLTASDGSSVVTAWITG